MIRNIQLTKNMVPADVEQREQVAGANGLLASEKVESINADLCEKEKNLTEREIWLNRCMENIKQFIRNIDISKL
ncbi:MAG: hypothetical protein N2260_05500 [Syntrophobacterales bacterium]|nr:hypothetical protein [Syntrophobacterales bacterium]